METIEEKKDGANGEIAASTSQTQAEEAASFDVSGSSAAVRNLAVANTEKKVKFFSTKNMVRLAVFTALSYVLYMFVKTPLPIFAPWLDLQISDLPALMAAFMTGPAGGAVVIVLKCIMKLPFTSTAFVGELADILMGLAFVLPPAFIYKKFRTRKGALLGLVVGAAFCTAVSALINAVVLVPFYVELYCHGDEQMLVGMLSGLFPSITWETFMGYYIGLSVVPFNLLRCALVGFLTFMLYKHTEKLFTALTPKKKVDAK
ncbi:MAG: ECF transporter S component [Clostridia bacterium]|nr:ECF transporter S component [Clostridia bacterium]